MLPRHVPRRPEAEQSPRTPSHSAAHNEISGIISKLENRWRLGLNANADRTWSPSASSGRQRRHEDCYKLIRLLYFKDREKLDELLAKFNAQARGEDPERRLDWLLQLLREQQQQKDPQTERRQSSLYQRFQEARSSPLSQTVLQNGAETPRPSSGRPSRIATGLGSAMQVDLPEPMVPTEPSTPVDQPMDETARPASPLSPSVQASARKETVSRQPLQRHDSHLSPRKKRLSDESLNSPSKLCKTSNERPTRTSDGVFALPAPKFPSYAMNRQPSFASTSTATNSVSNSQWSAYRSNTTMNTSFTSNATEPDTEFHSSGTISADSQERQALIDAAQSFDSSSNKISEPMRGMGLGPVGSPRPLNMMEPAVVDSPRSRHRMEQHQLANLPDQGLGVAEFESELSDKFKAFPFKQRWEFFRFALANNVPPDSLVPPLGDHYRAYDAFWDYLSKHKLCQKSQPSYGSSRAWDAAEGRFENISLKAELTYNQSNRGPFFNLALRPLETEKSCRFQRKFGGDRFLYVQVPPIRANCLPKGKGSERDVHQRYQEWLLQPAKRFLGRFWTIFHVETIKSKKSGSNSKAAGQRLVLFATHGCDISTKATSSVLNLLDWFMPLDLNSHQPFTKAFARIDLGLSRTDRGITFKPSQVRSVGDQLADGSPEDSTFNDMRYKWDSPHKTESPHVMNDGCSRISVGALLQHWRSNSSPGPIPSAIQGRIGGAKGVWMISASTDTSNPEHLDKWIEISESQRKFKPHPEDLTDHSGYDQNRLIFEPLAASAPPSASTLNKAFFPILLDRGVRKDKLRKLVLQCLDENRKQLLEAMEDPVDVRKWVNQQNSLSEERNRDGRFPWQGGLPMPLQEKVIFLLEAGFNPQDCPYLAESLERMVRQNLLQLRQKFDIPLPRSTYVLGVADPLGVLAPGEVHLMFSQNFFDDETGETKMFLDKMDILVARHPALRNSDVQKVKATFKMELAHLRDVIVFPSKGQFPLAGKLQGGDYDGDRFWICWEPDLVRGFLNAPAPYESPKPEEYGIHVDRRSLGDICAGNAWLRESFKFRNNPDLLGMVTKLHGKISYKYNLINNPVINKLADLHDLLVDSSKNGYVFDDSDYKKYVTGLGIDPKRVKDPAFEQGMQQDEMNRTYRTAGRVKIKHNADHILDHLYFEVIVPHTEKTLEQLGSKFSDGATLLDRDLLDPFDNEQQDSLDDPVRLKVLRSLEESVKEIRSTWNRLLGKSVEKSNPDDYNEALKETFNLYLRIKPNNPTNDPAISQWTRPMIPGAPSKWSLLKASAFATSESEIKTYEGERTSSWLRKPTCLFHIAGRELAFTKASKAGDCRMMVQPVWAMMKPRKGKKKGVVQVDGAVDEGQWESGDEDMEGA